MAESPALSPSRSRTLSTVVLSVNSLKDGISMQASQIQVSPILNHHFHPRRVSAAPECQDTKAPPATVYLIDGNSQTRKTLVELLDPLQMKVVSFGTAAEYLAYSRPDEAACLIIEIDLPDVSGLDLQRQIAGGTSPSIIFISGGIDVATTVRAMKAGAIEFLTKPVDPLAMVNAVHIALAEDRRVRLRKAELATLRERFTFLTPREREVLPLVVGGLVNKQSASLLGISTVTLQIHRNQIMRKMRAESFAELVRMSVKLRIRHWREDQSGHRQGHLRVV